MISILIPIYNTNIDYIRACFDSIDNQTFKNYEVVVVDDGSSFDIATFLDCYLSNSQYKIFHKTHEGISKALNYGLSQCKSNLVARMDADDIMHPQRLEKQLEYFTNHSADIVGTQMQLFGSLNYTTNHPPILNRAVMSHLDWFINHPTVMYNKDKILNVGGYNANFDGVEDLELWCRTLSNNFIIHNISEVLLFHRRHTHNSGWEKDHSGTIKQILNYYSQNNLPL